MRAARQLREQSATPLSGLGVVTLQPSVESDSARCNRNSQVLMLMASIKLTILATGKAI